MAERTSSVPVTAERNSGALLNANRTTGMALPSTHEKLTAREQEVLELIADGKTTKQIAATLGISFKTAAAHRDHILDKFDAHESVTVVRRAIREGIIRA